MNIKENLLPITKSILHLDRYVKLICLAQQSDFSNQLTEKHHILPKSLFASFATDSSNIVDLPVRWHFIAHLLLHKAVGGKMSRAFFMMGNRLDRKNSSHYSAARLLVVEHMRNKNPRHDLFVTNNPNADGSCSREAWKKSSPDRRKAQSELMSSLNKKHKSKPKETRQYSCTHCAKPLLREEFVHKEPKSNYYCDASCRNRHTAARKKAGEIG